MTISGFSYVCGGFNYGVPFLESYQSILPIVDELVVAVGDSTDGTREALLALNNPKIKIIDTLWDRQNRVSGKIFAEQSNIALDHIRGDWAFHIQADEVIHEQDLPKIIDAVNKFQEDEKTEGFILPFIHFWGGFNWIRTSRRVHKHEIRLFRAKLPVRSYRDSLGFRKYKSFTDYADGVELGYKLMVRKIDAPIYHYTKVRNPNADINKGQMIGYYYANEKEVKLSAKENFGYDRLEQFVGTHPAVMAKKVLSQNWEYTFDPSRANWRTKDRIMQPIEDLLGFKIGEYKNYKLIR